MNKRPTPETDAVRDNVFDIWGGWSDNAAKKLLQHARRLERERDAERALADRLAGALTNPATYVALEALTAWKEARSE